MTRLTIPFLAAFSISLLACHGHDSPTDPIGAPHASGSLTATVSDRAGTSLSGLRFELHDRASVRVHNTTIGTGGAVAISSIEPGEYLYSVVMASNDSLFGGILWIAPGPNVRALELDTGGCSSAYGTVRDARTSQPIAGAQVTWSGRQATTAQDGSYRLDFGCSPSSVTVEITVTHSAYKSFSIFSGVPRGTIAYDFVLEPRD